jgi:hypothetical protein
VINNNEAFLFPDGLQGAVKQLAKRISGLNMIPGIRSAVTGLVDSVKKNTETLLELKQGIVLMTAEQAAEAQVVLYHLPMRTAFDVKKYLGNPIYRYISTTL